MGLRQPGGQRTQSQSTVPGRPGESAIGRVLRVGQPGREPIGKNHILRICRPGVDRQQGIGKQIPRRYGGGASGFNQRQVCGGLNGRLIRVGIVGRIRIRGAGGYHSGIAQDVGGRGTQDALQQQCLLLAGRNNARGIRIAPGIPALAVVCGELGIQQHAGYSVAQQHFLAVGGAGVADLNGILKELAGNGGGRGSLLHNGQIG